MNEIDKFYGIRKENMIDFVLILKEYSTSDLPGIIKIRSRRKQIMGITSMEFGTCTIISEDWNYPEFIEGDSEKEKEVFLELIEKCGMQGENDVYDCTTSALSSVLKAMKKILVIHGIQSRTILYRKDLKEYLGDREGGVDYFPIKGTKNFDFAVLGFPQTLGVISRDGKGKFAMGIFSYPVVIGKVVPSAEQRLEEKFKELKKVNYFDVTKEIPPSNTTKLNYTVRAFESMDSLVLQGRGGEDRFRMKLEMT